KERCSSTRRGAWRTSTCWRRRGARPAGWRLPPQPGQQSRRCSAGGGGGGWGGEGGGEWGGWAGRARGRGAGGGRGGVGVWWWRAGLSGRGAGLGGLEVVGGGCLGGGGGVFTRAGALRAHLGQLGLHGVELGLQPLAVGTADRFPLRHARHCSHPPPPRLFPRERLPSLAKWKERLKTSGLVPVAALALTPKQRRGPRPRRRSAVGG